MRTVTLELLRHGPAHNQLLSPLTPYFALCGNHQGVTIKVPFEHNQFLHRLRALGHEVSPEAAIFQLRDTAKELGDILSLIPGLTADVAQDARSGDPLHLRLIISASELALLPFELALSPAGHPGAGGTFLLQPNAPICLTRETRRFADPNVRWPRKAKILFAFASPDGREVPAQAHLLALRRAINPWVMHAPSDDGSDNRPSSLLTGRRAGVHDLLTVLPFASLKAIEDACAGNEYTHVHVLAHGAAFPVGEDVRFGLQLHHESDADQSDVVSGDRLATALMAARRAPANGLTQPPIVTLAACDGAKVGTVAGAGASIAHALNSRGVPLVVASQFPLSFEGSVRMVEILYEGLLWGEDPRIVLDDLRRRLFTGLPKTHDWASLTAYASFPADLEEQLREIRIEQATDALDVALDLADKAAAQTDAGDDDLRSVGLKRIANATARLDALLDGEASAERCSRICGLLASMAKREAQMLSSGSGVLATRALEALERARALYWRTFKHDQAKSWAIVQYLSLDILLDAIRGAEVDGDDKRKRGDLTLLASALSRTDLDGLDEHRRMWAAGNLIELAILGRRLPNEPEVAPDQTVKIAKDLIQNRFYQFEIYSICRQIGRYEGWFSEIAPNFLTEDGRALAAQLSEVLSSKTTTAA